MILLGAEGRKIAVEESSRDFGRPDFLDWVAPAKADFISHRHFRIVAEKGEFFIEHLSKVNPTAVNGESVKGRLPLKEGDTIDIAYGVLTLTVSFQE